MLRPLRPARSALLLAGLALALPPGAAGLQNPGEPAPRALPPPASYPVARAPGPIQVDGRVDDPGWRDAVEIPIDWEWTPGDNTPAPVRSACRVTYDEANLYIGCRAFDPRPEEIRARYFGRDDIERLVLDDHFNILLDPFNDRRRAFQFRVSALGGQADALLSTAEGFEDWSWDTIWASAGQIDADGYAVEVAIPFKSLRFPRTEDVQTWGILLERSWPRSVRHRMQSAPRDRNNTCLLCEANRLVGLQGIAPGRNLELDPALTAGRTDRRAEFPAGPLESGDLEPSFGVDLVWGISPNLTLNATANPDFSQVEADAAQLDVNTRFALFFPEKRPFFLEGADLFSTPIRAVFTRTVADPDAGLKLSGKVGRGSGTAFGVFAARDAITNLVFPGNQGSARASLEQEAYTTVGRIRRDLGRASSVGGLYTGRFGEGYANQVGGVDLFHQFNPSTTLRAQALGSLTEYPEGVAGDFAQPAGRFAGSAVEATLLRVSARWLGRVSYEDRSPSFRADAGFVPRVDVRRVSGELARLFRRDRGWFTQLEAGVFYDRVHNHAGDLTDETYVVGVNYQGPLQSFASVQAAHARERLLDRLFDLNRVSVAASLRPSAAGGFAVHGRFGDAVDVANARRAREVSLSSSAQLSIGRGLGLDLSHVFQRLSHEGAEVFTANLVQTRAIYNFSVRTFVRGIVQYRSVSRNPAKYGAATSPFDEGLFGQFLFSYIVNPQTLVFLGYSENQAGAQAFDLTRSDRTFFVKVGYAWRL